jgi:hypothetical protein
MIGLISYSVCKNQHYFSLLKYVMAFFLLWQGLLLAQDVPERWGDVVFNEVMADPNPPVHYALEYLELHNRTDQMVDLESWVLQINARKYSLSESMMPEGTLLSPGAFGVVTGLTLPNGGATLSLYNPVDFLVHAASYGVPWNGTEWKKEGGWSLESPDPEQVCKVSDLWEYSSDPAGGTPGRINSNYSTREDMDPPVLLYSGYGDPDENALGGIEPGLLRLFFSEPVVLSPADLHKILLLPGNISPLEVDLLAPLSTIVELNFPVDLQERHINRVKIPMISDCQGNERGPLESMGGLVSEAVFGSVQINEIMYDPAEGYPEYIELAMPGTRFYDLRELAIHVVEEGAPADDPLPLSDHSRLMVPGNFLVVTGSVEHLRDAYHLESSGLWVEVESLKTLNNAGGTLYLTDRAGNVVDMVSYGDQMHVEILSDTRGISLERISGEGSGSDSQNWHSAAAIEGYATPGRVNSQALTEASPDHLFQVDPGVFSPDNDGYHDLLEIVVAPGEQGWIISLWVTDLQGNLLRNLANNHLSGPLLTYSWDGAREDGSMVPPGICVVHATAYHSTTGGRWIRKRAVGVVYR